MPGGGARRLFTMKGKEVRLPPVLPLPPGLTMIMQITRLEQIIPPMMEASLSLLIPPTKMHIDISQCH